LGRSSAPCAGPLGQQFTTQEAADLLGISRPTLIKLLEEGRISYETPGRHRRLRLNDVLTYQAQRRQERRSTLDELAADAQALGAYEEPPEFFEAASSEARRKLA
jgi:excisionase family DNA binding protein